MRSPLAPPPLFMLLALALSLLQSREALEGLEVGHFVEIRGTLGPDGMFEAEKVEVLDPDDEALIGTVAPGDTDAAGFRLLGQPIVTDGETRWQGIDRGRQAGQRIKVEGDWKGPRRFVASKISARDQGRDRIAGRLDDLHPVADGWEGRVMIFHVHIPAGVELVHERELASYALAPERRVADVDLDEVARDDDDEFGSGFRLGSGALLSGQLEAKSTFERNYDLDDTQARDRDDYLGSARLRLDWTITDDVVAVLEARETELWRADDRAGHSSVGNGLLGETFLFWRDALGPGLDVAVGRQDFDDPREWIYDQNLDGLRLVWTRPGWSLDLAATTTVTDGTERDRDSFNLSAYLSNRDRKRHLAAWTLYRDIGDHASSTRDAFGNSLPTVVSEHNLHVGVRALGKWLPRQESWFDLAALVGSRHDDVSGSRDVAAWGYDAGTVWSPSFAPALNFTLGYALGKGDRGDTGTDHTFRQTGFQDNTGKFAGVTSLQYYGELVDPELSNLGILTLGVGLDLPEKTSIDLIAHQYTQDVPGLDLSAQPVQSSIRRGQLSGTDSDLGTEVDLVLGFRRFRSWDLEIVGAWFHPGSAFTVGDDATLAKIQLRYRF